MNVAVFDELFDHFCELLVVTAIDEVFGLRDPVASCDVGIAFFGCEMQGVEECSPYAFGGAPLHASLDGDFVGLLEADPVDVEGELVRVFVNDGGGALESVSRADVCGVGKCLYS